MSLITKVNTQGENEVTGFYDIGANAENIFIKDEEENNFFSLKQLYKFLKTFFNKEMFIFRGKEDPTDNNKIIIWDKIEEILEENSEG